MNALYLAAPRPGSVPVRTTPRTVRLYFSAGMPARAAFRIIWQRSSISLSRSGLRPSRIFGFSDRLISFELRGSGTMSSAIPNLSTRSLSRINPSTDHRSSSLTAGSVLQMWLTPSAARTASVSSEESCWVPTFISALGAGAGDAAGGSDSIRASARASPAAANAAPAPAVRKKCLRCIPAPTRRCGFTANTSARAFGESPRFHCHVA